MAELSREGGCFYFLKIWIYRLRGKINYVFRIFSYINIYSDRTMRKDGNFVYEKKFFIFFGSNIDGFSNKS